MRRALGRVLGVTEENPTVRDLGEATGADVVGEPASATRERLGEAFADELQGSGALVQRESGSASPRAARTGGGGQTFQASARVPLASKGKKGKH